MSGKPVINYFAICGRGELSRLIAAAGDVEFEDKAWAPAFDPEANPTGLWRPGYKEIGEAFGFPGVLPVLEHGDLKLFQTTAIESYLANISPVYSKLTPAQKAKDEMFQLIKSDINGTTESLLFGKIGPEALTPVMEKWYPIIEGLLPATGYINGLEYPTPGDLAMTVVAMGCMPFRAAVEKAGCVPTAEKYPKLMALAAACMAYPKVAAFLAKSEHKTLKADPFGIMPAEYKD